MEHFKSTLNGFNYVFEKELNKGEELFLKMPPVSANKRGINDIGWQTDGSVKLYGTLSKNLSDALWSEIEENFEVNKTVSALKILNEGEKCKIAVRVILN